MLIAVTGEIGIGKSTVCRQVINLYHRHGHVCGGVISYKDEDGNITVEDIRLGTSMTLASRSPVYKGPQIGAYFFNPDGIAFGMEALNRAIDLPLIVIDEIGPLEMSGNGFTNCFAAIKRQKNGDCMVVTRNGLLHTLLPRLGEEPVIFEITAKNRDTIPYQIGQTVLR